MGTSLFRYVVNDGNTDGVLGTVFVTIAPVTNRAPVGRAPTLTMPRNTVADIQLGFFDADGDAVTFQVKSQPAHGQLSGTAPNLHYTPNAGFSGADTFTFTVNDGQLTSELETVHINVTASGLPPVVTLGDAPTIDEGNAVSASLESSDPDGSVVSTQFDWGDGTVDELFSHTYNDNGVYTITVTVTDNSGATASASTTITVNNVPPQVSLTLRNEELVTGRPGTAFFSAFDVAADPLAFSLDWGDGTVVPTTGDRREPHVRESRHVRRDPHRRRWRWRRVASDKAGRRRRSLRERGARTARSRRGKRRRSRSTPSRPSKTTRDMVRVLG